MSIITILGTGHSMGVPVIGCQCIICRKKINYRTRSSILISHENKNILIDPSPDLRLQLIRAQIRHIDAILFTHSHFDHVNGLGDIIPLTNRKDNIDIKIFFDKETSDVIYNRFEYLFKLNLLTSLSKNIITPYKNFNVYNINFLPILNNHGKTYSIGYIFNECVYITDFKYLEEKSISILKNNKIKKLIISCLGISTTGHADISDVMKYIKIINPSDEVFLTHMGHTIDLDTFDEKIKEYLKRYEINISVKPAFDNMSFKI